MLFKEFYGMYEPEEQEVIALINRCIGGGYNNRGDFWEMTVVTLGMVPPENTPDEGGMGEGPDRAALVHLGGDRGP